MSSPTHRSQRARVIDTGRSSDYTAVYSFHEAIRAAGLAERSLVKAQGIVFCPAAATQLGLAEDAPLFNLVRVRLADGIRIASDQVWIPEELGRPLLEVDFSHTALYWELRDHCGISVTGGRETSRAATASPDEARELECRPGDPILKLERLCFSSDRPVEFRQSVIAGNRFQMVHHFGLAPGSAE